MPSETPKQRVAMAMCCRQPDKCKAGIPKSVACEYHRADQRKRKRGLVESKMTER